MDLEKLKGLVNDSFLDKNLKCRKIKNPETFEEEVEIYLPLRCISALHLEEEEEMFIIEYLGSKGIKIRGSFSYYSDFDYYTQSGKLQIYKKVYQIPKEEQESYLKEYEKTKDINIRNKLIEANMHLVNRLAHRYHHLFQYDYDMLKSYGSEALMGAIERYDFSKGSFKVYSEKCISFFMINCIVRGTFGASGWEFASKISKQDSEDSNYYQYFDVQHKVERMSGEKLQDNPELIEQIALELESEGYCEGELLEELKNRISIYNPYSIEQIEENLCYLDDDTLYGEAVEKVFQQELAEFIEDITEKLSEKNKTALRSYYGLGGRESSNLENIGKMEGVTHETIRLRCKRGKENLKKMMNSWYCQRSSMTKSFLEYSNHEYENNVHSAYLKRK